MSNVSAAPSRKFENLKNSPSIYKAMLLEKPEAQECYPFGEDVAVFKIREKMFATFSLSFKQGSASDSFEAMNLKCDPNNALILRDVFDAVIPGYHMNKQHWNTVILDGSIPEQELSRMIDHSYALVVKRLKRADRQALISKFGEGIIEPGNTD